LPLALVFAGLTASTALANHATATVTCTQVAISYAEFPNALNNTTTEEVAVDGTTIVDKSFSFNGETGLDTITISLTAGTHEVFVHTFWNTNGVSSHFEETFEVTCGPPPQQGLCVETTNPHGKTIPPAGQTPPGTNPKSGQNPDGFYEIGTETGEGEVFVEDGGSGTIFGPYPPGTKIKYTQAPGGTPEEKKIGSTTGQAGAVLVHITGTGDAFVFSSNGVRVPCLVPPPPK
jgi:hypothetical protein